MSDLLHSLQTATTLSEVQRAVGQAKTEELDARSGRKVREALERCAKEIAGVKFIILAFLHDALGAKTVAEVDALAGRFKEELNAITADDMGEETGRQEGKAGGEDPAVLLGDPEEAGFAGDIVDRPDESLLRLTYADWLDDHGRTASAALTRIEQELRQKKEPISEALLEAREAAKHDHAIETLKRFFPDPHLWPDDWKEDGRLDHVGISLPEKVIAAFAILAVPRQVEVLEALLRLPEQFADNLSSLRRARLLRREKGLIQKGRRWVPALTHAERHISANVSNEGYIDYQGCWHRLTYSDSGDPANSLVARLHVSDQAHRTMLFQRALQGFDCLVITPRLHVPRLCDALLARLQENAGRIPGTLAENVFERHFDPMQETLYHSRTVFGEGGQPLTGGYDIVLVEDRRVLPMEGDEPVTAGYRSPGTNLRPSDYLGLLHGQSSPRAQTRDFDPEQYEGLIGTTPQMHCAHTMLSLDISGQPLDLNDDPYYGATFLIGASMDLTGYTPIQICFHDPIRLEYTVGSDDGDTYSGARFAVRVL